MLDFYRNWLRHLRQHSLEHHRIVS